MKKVAVIIPTFNMPERTQALVSHLEVHSGDLVEIIVVDNGSLPEYKFRTPAVSLRDNVQTTNGWLAGLNYADAFEAKYAAEFDAYLIAITSADIPAASGDIVTPMLNYMYQTYDCVACSPALTADSTTSWEHMKVQGRGWRSTWMLDNIFTLYRASWFNSIGRFDPQLLYAWGSDLETSWKARSDGRKLMICDDLQVRKVTDIGYTMDRMGMTSEDRRVRARANMGKVFIEKYGPNWTDMMYSQGE